MALVVKTTLAPLTETKQRWPAAVCVDQKEHKNMHEPMHHHAPAIMYGSHHDGITPIIL